MQIYIYVYIFIKIYIIHVLLKIFLKLINSIILVSGMQHNDSISLQIIFHYKLLHDNGYDSLYSILLLLIYFIHSSLYLLIPYS